MGQIGRRRGGVPVVRCGRSRRNECGAPAPQRLQIAVPARGVRTGQLAQRGDVGVETGAIGIDHVVRAEGRHDASRPTGLAELRVRCERVDCTVGRGEEFHPEAVEERRAGSPAATGAPRSRRTPRRRSWRRAVLPRRRPLGACDRARASTGCPGRGCPRVASSRQICLPSVAAGPPSSGCTPSDSSGTPWL